MTNPSYNNINFKKNNFVGPLLVLSAAGWWAADIIFRQNLYTGISPLVLSFLEVFFNVILVSPIFFIYFAQIKKINLKGWLGLIYAGIFGTAIANIFLNAGYSSDVTAFSLLYQLQPVWTIISAYFLLKEKITIKFALLAFSAFTGAFLVTFGDDLAAGNGIQLGEINGVLAGAICGLVASLCWGFGTTISKVTLNQPNVDAKLTSAFRYFFGLVGVSIVLTFSYIYNQIITTTGEQVADQQNQGFISFISSQFISFSDPSTLFKLENNQWLSLLAIVVFGFVAIYAYYTGLSKTKANIATFCEMGYPIVAVFLAYFINNSWDFSVMSVGGFFGQYTTLKWFGISMLISSVLVISLTQNTEKIRKKI